MARIKARFKSTSSSSPEQRLVELAKGEYIFERGDLGTEMYVIREGSIEVLNPGIDSRPIAVLEKGDFFGEMAILEGAPRTASARAAVDSQLVRIDEATFSRLLRRDPEVSVRIMRKLSKRIRHLEELLLERGAVVPLQSEVTNAGQEAVFGSADPNRESGDADSGPRLLHPGTGLTFELSLEETSPVGRRDPITGSQPTVDLTPIDPERSCSRLHARIYLDGDTYFVAEDISTTNGTFLNETRLNPGEPVAMSSGDRVRFGLVTLEFSV